MTETSVERVGPEAASIVLGIVRAAFSGRAPLDPPADALAETEESIAAALERHGGLVAWSHGEPVGALIFDDAEEPGVTFLRRVGVLPSHQHAGVAHWLAGAAHVHADPSVSEVAVLARHELPKTVAFWESLGFARTRELPPYIELRRPRLPTGHLVQDAEEMRSLGAQVGRGLRAGDVVLLIGELGAGKTTFTQGLGAGLGVRAGITSPTFVLSRIHPSLDSGPALVHVDAYRLSGQVELDDLDLDAGLGESVTVVEWGERIAEALADSRLEVRIERTLGDETTPESDGPDPRQVTLTRVGVRPAIR